MDEILGREFKLLDHGFIRVVDYMGGDAAIVQAARISYGTGTKSHRKDAALIKYLLRRAHTTPFEMCELKLHVKMPIFVARQWIRHRTANVNEYSARYSILDKEFYVPDLSQVRLAQTEKKFTQKGQGILLEGEKGLKAVAQQSLINKQGRSAPMTAAKAEEYVRKIREISLRAYTAYEKLLDNNQGLSRELARMVLPTNFYTQWFWKIDLHNLLKFLLLRADAHAQYETRVYAQAIINEILPRWAPEAAEAFAEYQWESFNLSRSAKGVVKGWLARNLGRRAGQTRAGEEEEAIRRLRDLFRSLAKQMGGREWRELKRAFRPDKNRNDGK